MRFLIMIINFTDRSGNIQWIKSTPVNAGQYMMEFGAPLNSLQIK